MRCVHDSCQQRQPGAGGHNQLAHVVGSVASGSIQSSGLFTAVLADNPTLRARYARIGIHRRAVMAASFAATIESIVRAGSL